MTTLYRIYGKYDDRDKDGLGAVGTRLLYVGITDNYDRRMAQHSEKKWWTGITKITRQEFDDRTQAAIAERAAIASESPVHNRAGRATDAPLKSPPAPKAQRHPSSKTDPWLSLAESADYLGVCTKTIRRYISQGEVPAMRVKGSRLIRVRRSELDALLKPIPSAKDWN